MTWRILTLYFILSVRLLYAQDALFDFSYENRLTMNPSFAGNDGEGKLRTSLFHHRQFINNRGPFHHSSLSIDYAVCNIPLSIGLIVQQETQGDGYLKTNSFAPIIGGSTNITKSSSINFGMKYNIINYSIDLDRLYFSNQLNALSDNIDPSSLTGSNLINDFTNGLTLGVNYSRWDIKGRKRKLNHMYNVGVALNHFIISPRFSLINYDKKLDNRLTLHAKYYFKKPNTVIDNQKEIVCTYDIQGEFQSIMLSTGVYIEKIFFIGIGNRWTINSFNNSPRSFISCRIGKERQLLQFQFLYGFNIAQNSSGLGNAFEFGIVYTPSKSYCGNGGLLDKLLKTRKNKRMVCPSSL